MTVLDVRVASASDADKLAEVAALTFGLACPPETTEQAKKEFIASTLSRERFGEYLTRPGTTVLAASVDRAIVGYTMLIEGDPIDQDVLAAVTSRPTIELSKCYVLAGQHGLGVAAALMDRTLEHATATGARTVWLGVNDENARAQRFYSKHGFAQVGTKRFHLGDRFESDWVMERPLS